MRKVYIAGPYTAPTPEKVEENVKRAEAAAWLYYLIGYAVFCPHTQTHKIHLRYNYDELIGYDDWLQADIAFLKDCDLVAFLPGWEDSKGARMEFNIAIALGIQITFIDERQIEAVLNNAE